MLFVQLLDLKKVLDDGAAIFSVSGQHAIVQRDPMFPRPVQTEGYLFVAKTD